MARNYSKLRAKMSAKARDKSEKITQELMDEMPLQELRQARALSQEQLAKELNIKQASVSKLERRTDMYIKTLRSYIEAMGGVLEISAKFPEGKVRIKQFADENSEVEKHVHLNSDKT